MIKKQAMTAQERTNMIADDIEGIMQWEWDSDTHTAKEIYETMGIWKFNRVHKALRLLENEGRITSKRVGHRKVYKLAK